MDSKQNNYSAFISYNSHDDKWAKWLQKRLENYNMPSVVANEKGETIKSYSKSEKKLKIFRYVTDLVAQNLNDGLKEELDKSQHLIVICSPNSAKSKWVGKEISYFVETGRKKKIIPFIVDGTPYSNDDNDCFNPELKKAFPEGELLGVDVHDIGDDYRIFGKRKAVAKVVSLIMEMPEAYSFIWNRYRNRLLMLSVFRVLLALLVVAAVAITWLLNSSFNTTVSLNDTSVVNENLPAMKNTVVTLYLDDETKTDTLKTSGDVAVFKNIPHKYLGEDVRVTFTCAVANETEQTDYMPLDTVLSLGKNVVLNVKRNEEKYGTIHFTLWRVSTEEPVANAEVTVGGIPAVSNSEGRVALTIPVEKQKVITDEVNGRVLYRIESESLNLIDGEIEVPHTEDAIIIVE